METNLKIDEIQKELVEHCMVYRRILPTFDVIQREKVALEKKIGDLENQLKELKQGQLIFDCENF